MTNNRVRIGVVGTGSIALRGILPHLTQEDVQDRLRVTAVCDPVPGRAQAAAEKFGVPAAFENYEDLLAAGDVDAVTLASPIGIHYEQGKLAIARGVHVHFNKTMTTTVDEADELISLAKSRGVKLVACPGEMLRPLNQQIRRLVMSGEDLANIGPVALLQDLAVVATLGVSSVERNGHHYFAGLSAFPRSVQEQVLALHGDLYERSAADWPSLCIQGGELCLDSVVNSPLGVGFELDVAQFTPRNQWQTKTITQEKIQ